MIIPSLLFFVCNKSVTSTDKNDSWSRLSSEGSFTPISCHLPHLTSHPLIYQSRDTQGAAHTQRTGLSAWTFSCLTARRTNGSKPHLLFRPSHKDTAVCVYGRDPNRQTTQHSSIESQCVHSSHRLVQLMTKHDTYKQNSAPLNDLSSVHCSSLPIYISINTLLKSLTRTRKRQVENKDSGCSFSWASHFMGS